MGSQCPSRTIYLTGVEIKQQQHSAKLVVRGKIDIDGVCGKISAEKRNQCGRFPEYSFWSHQRRDTARIEPGILKIEEVYSESACFYSWCGYPFRKKACGFVLRSENRADQIPRQQKPSNPNPTMIQRIGHS